jgi:hypothetical protein
MALMRAAVELLSKSRVRFATFGFATWSDSERPVLRCRPGEALVYLDAPPRADDQLLVHVHHPMIEKLSALGQRDMAGAAHLLSRAVCLRQGVAPSLGERLLGRTLGSLRG